MGEPGNRPRDADLRLTLGWVADAVGGTIRTGDRDGEIGNIVTDTRTLQPGDFFIALRGDPSDGLPGARGIGEKTARDLLDEHGSLDALLAAAERPVTSGLRPRVAETLREQAEELLQLSQWATTTTTGGGSSSSRARRSACSACAFMSASAAASVYWTQPTGTGA